MLALLVLLPTVALIANAENGDDKSVGVSLTRFMTEEILSENAELSVNSDMSVKLTLNASVSTVSMKTVPIEANTKANALRIVIRNNSECDKMKIDYIFKNSAKVSESASIEEVSLKMLADATEYIVYMPSVDTLTQLSIRFSGASEGDIDIVSIGAVSVFHDNRTYFGELVENSYDGERRTAVFAGSVSYDTLLQYPDAKVVLYRLAQTEVIEDVRFVHPYVESCPMTLNYRFEFDIENTSEYCSRYFAAVLTVDNKVIPLTSETYLKEKHTDGEEAKGEGKEIGFKGIETDLYAGAVENGTSVAFVDVRLDRMKNESGDGYQYILDDGKEYYFDRAYVLELDEEIKSLSAFGVSVYLRFLLDSPSFVFGHLDENVTSENTKYYAVDPQNDDVVDNIFAYTDFICSRYADMADGSLKGIVLGRSLDKALKYNYCGSVSMNQYADMLAKTYSIMRIALDRSGGDLEIVIPMSDDKIGTEVILTASSREDDYPADILVRAFLSSLNRYGSDVSSMYFMLESDGKPNLWSGSTAIVSKMTADNCEDFIEMAKDLSTEYKDLSDKIMFCWFPSANISTSELLNIYAYNYNYLSCNDGIRNYIVSIFEREEIIDVSGAARSAEEYIFSTLKSTYKYVDTDNNPRVCAPALESLGKLSWEALIEGYSTDKTVKRELYEKDVVYTLPDGISGSYKMWDFFTANGTGGWSRSDGCTALSVYTRSEFVPRSLVATLCIDAELNNGADYGSIIYRAPESLLMRDISAVSFDILIPQGAYGSIFEVKVTVCADGAVNESSGIVKVGEKTVVYADISELELVEYIKVGVRNLSDASTESVDMCIESISIHSKKYNDAELENMVLSGDIIDKKEENNNTAKKNEESSTVIVILAVSIAFVATLWLCMTLSLKKKKR